MVGEIVLKSQSLYLFTFNAFIIIHEYIYSHSTTKFIFKIYQRISYSRIYLLTFTRCIHLHVHSTVYIHSHSTNIIGSTRCNIHSAFCAHCLRAYKVPAPAPTMREGGAQTEYCTVLNQYCDRECE